MNSIRGLSTIDRSRFRTLETETTKSTSTQPQRRPAFEDSNFQSGQPPKGPPPFLDAAAGALGLSTEDLSARLQAGESLEDIASAQGVSTDTVTQAIADDFKASHPEATDEQASAIAQRALEGPRQPPPFPDIDALAEKLGLSTEELTTQLKSGTSLSDIASAQGVSLQSLAPQPFRISDIQSRNLEP